VGFVANLSPAGRIPQRGKVQSGEMARIRSRLPFGTSRCLRRKRQLNELRKDPLPPPGGGGGGGVGGVRAAGEYPAARHGPFTYTMSAQVYVNLTLSLAGRASVRSGKGVSDRIDESKFRFLNGLLPPPQPSPTGEGAERRNGVHSFPPPVRRFPLFTQKAAA